MPGYDKTGPEGQGQMTGGGRGYCVPRRQDIQSGYGVGRGGLPRGGGRGRCFGGGRGRGFGVGRSLYRGFRGIFQPDTSEDVKQESKIIKLIDKIENLIEVIKK